MYYKPMFVSLIFCRKMANVGMALNKSGTESAFKALIFNYTDFDRASKIAIYFIHTKIFYL